MAVYKRGGTWWYKFKFEGQVIRESAKTCSKTVAREAEKARRRKLEEGFNGIRRRDRAPLLKSAADAWLDSKTALTPLGRAYYSIYAAKLKREIGARLISDIGLDEIAALQRKRLGQGLSARSVNCEIATLRQILKRFGLWAQFSGQVKFLRESTDAGKALSREEEARLLDAIGRSPSPSLLPFFVLSLDGGLRPSETRGLRHRDLRLTWRDGVIAEGEVIVGQSKTEAGSGRAVPLTRRAAAALTLWLARFPQAKPDSYVFPFHHIGISTEKNSKNKRIPWLWGVNLDKPMSRASYKRSFDTAQEKAGVKCRFYDARHSFVTRLAENPAVSVETIRQLAGHVSEKMLSRYAHIRVQARRTAIATLEPSASETALQTEIAAEGAQKWAQYRAGEKPILN